MVLRYRFFLEQKNLAASTINVRLAAVRRLAYEASDSGLLSPDLAAGIRRVKGVPLVVMFAGESRTAHDIKVLLSETIVLSYFGSHAKPIKYAAH